MRMHHAQRQHIIQSVRLCHVFDSVVGALIHSASSWIHSSTSSTRFPSCCPPDYGSSYVALHLSSNGPNPENLTPIAPCVFGSSSVWCSTSAASGHMPSRLRRRADQSFWTSSAWVRPYRFWYILRSYACGRTTSQHTIEITPALLGFAHHVPPNCAHHDCIRNVPYGDHATRYPRSTAHNTHYSSINITVFIDKRTTPEY